MKLNKTKIKDLIIVKSKVHFDKRGFFREAFKRKIVKKKFIFGCASSSKKNVIRGMHFQTDESAHNKIIHCIRGSIVDVCVDIRRSSPFYNQPVSIKLHEDSNLAIFVPKGFAHGFLSLEDDTIVQYMADKEHNPLKDKGILWNSIDYEWECNNPILSKRDLSHPSIGDQECIFF